ncbi:hypothetical protein AAHA92_21545 [Salvia divinorum]|uniref:Uncharacterized protein n=1 Tax=Salvia divinorum TaxID=28513 RepID=A0ABD1GNU9_SALDI
MPSSHFHLRLPRNDFHPPFLFSFTSLQKFQSHLRRRSAPGRHPLFSASLRTIREPHISHRLAAVNRCCSEADSPSLEAAVRARRHRRSSRRRLRVSPSSGTQMRRFGTRRSSSPSRVSRNFRAISAVAAPLAATLSSLPHFEQSENPIYPIALLLSTVAARRRTRRRWRLLYVQDVIVALHADVSASLPHPAHK